MYPFPQSMTPTVRTHVDAQTVFVNEMSKSLFRSFQQHIARLASDAQVELARVTEQHVQHTTRTARAVVDDLARTSAEEAERGIRSQQEALRTMTDPFARVNGAMHARGDGAAEPLQQAGQHAAQQAAQQVAQVAQASQQARQQGATH